ncbi:unnamed protein product [Pedinophyceae sp. YPF-701]|nr:unnamed protein product [Pedinophyceae sp. YPF-701]
MAANECPAHRPSAFEELIASAPAVLESLPEESRRAVAATSWAALLATLKHTSAVLLVSLGTLDEGALAVVRGLARRMERRNVPAPSSLRLWVFARDRCNDSLCAHTHVEVAADDAATVVDLADALRARSSLDGGARNILEQLAVQSGAPVRVRAISIRLGPECGTWNSRRRREALMLLLGRPATQEHLKVLRVSGLEFRRRRPATPHLAQLLSSIPNLECLKVDPPGEGWRICKDICDGLRGLRRLRRLHLWCPPHGDELLPPPNETMPVTEAMLSLASKGCIEELRLTGFHNFLFDDVPGIEQMLRSNTTLRKLELDAKLCVSASGVGTKVCGAIGAALGANHTLTRLVLSGNVMVEGKHGVALMEGVGKNRSLRELVFESTWLSGEALAGLGRAVAAGSVLSHVTLRSVGPCMQRSSVGQGLVMFARSVMDKSCIESLTLENCSLDDYEVFELAKAIKHGALGRTLHQLNVSYNADITDWGAAALASARQQGCALEELHLRGCSVSIEEPRELAQALRTNTTLRTLDLMYNGIGRAGGAALAAALGAGSVLHELRLGDNDTDGSHAAHADPMDDSTAQAFVRAVRRGAAVRVFDAMFWDNVANEGTREALAALGCRRGRDAYLPHGL